MVVSGDEDAVLEVGRRPRAAGQDQRLRVSHAFHSPLMTPMLAEFGRLAQGLSYRPPTIPIVSTVTGRPVLSGELCGTRVLGAARRDSVRFADAVRAMADAGGRTFLELGPAGVLRRWVRPAWRSLPTRSLCGALTRTVGESRVVSASAR